jgi:hypothetical protein
MHVWAAERTAWGVDRWCRQRIPTGDVASPGHGWL